MKVGSNIPSVHVQQIVDGDVQQIDLAEFSAGKTILIVAVVGAFTPPCKIGRAHV